MTNNTPRTFSSHVYDTLTLGVPLVGSQLGGMLMNTTDTVMLGWYGINELAAGAIATQFLFTVMLFGAGFAYAVVPMASQAEGKGDVVAVRRSVRMGLWVSFLFCCIAMVPLWFVEPLFLALGQEAEIAALSERYMHIAQWSVFPLLMWWALRGFYTAIERTALVFWCTLAGVLLNAAINWLLIFGNFGFPELGIVGAAYATLASQSVVFGLLVWFAIILPRAAPYALFVRFWKPDWEMFTHVFWVGLPIGLMITAETGLFIISSIFMGQIGVVPLAAHGIVLQIASLAFMVPMGMSQAATARVGAFRGQAKYADLRRAAFVVLALCMAFAVLSAALFLMMPETLLSLFLDRSTADAAAVLAYGIPLLFLAACFQLTDTAQAIGAANLRGLEDTRVPMIIAIISYWPIGLGLGYILAFHYQLHGVGVWIGLAAGLGVAAVALNWRFWAIYPRG